MINVKFKVQLKHFQQQIVDCFEDDSIKNIVVTASRQIGKSYVMRYIILKTLLKPKQTIGYATPTNRLAKEFYQKILSSIPKELITISNGQDLIIQLINGSRLFFISIEAIDSLRGLTLDYAFYDEVASFKEVSPSGNHWLYDVCLPFLDVKGKKSVFISTPKGKTGTFWDLYNKAKTTNGWQLIECPITKDETKTTEWIEEKRKSMPEIKFRQEYLCEFLSESISYFSGFDDLFSLLENKDSLTGNTYLGIDLSANGTDNTIVTLVDSRNNVKQYCITGCLDLKYKQIADIINNTNITFGYIEKNGVGSPIINEIYKLLTPNKRPLIKEYQTTNENKNDNIQRLALLLERKELHFFADNTLLYNELQTYQLTKSKTGKNIFNAKVGYKDDTIMSLAIALSAKANKPKSASFFVIDR